MALEILIVEDDPDIAQLIKTQISALGMNATVEADGEDGFNEALSRKYALVVLDVELPRMNGLDICRALRHRNIDTPILMLTARGAEIDRVVGLELGADDYVTKPFSIAEFVARIRALLRRIPSVSVNESYALSGGKIFRCGDLEINFDLRAITRNTTPVVLTALEYQLLEFLLSRPGRVFTREELIVELWGAYFPNIEASLTRVICRLRMKLELDSAKPQFLKTALGIGYKWELPGAKW